MRKVPVVEVIKFSYLLLFRNFGTIVRLTWFPLTVVAIVQYAVGYLAIDAQIAAGGFDRAVPGKILWDILTGAVAVVAYSMVAVALHRLILFDDRKPGTFLLFSLGRAEWLFIAFAILIWIAIVVAGALISGVATAISATPAVLGVLAVGIFLAGFYLWTRLMPLYPVVVVEKRLDFRAALDLSRGNFWRLLGVSALGLLPLVIMVALISMLVFPSVAQLEAIATSSSDPVREVGEALKRSLLPMSVVNLVVSIVSTGLGIPLICYSYKALRNIGPFEYLEEHPVPAQQEISGRRRRPDANPPP